MPNLPTKPDFLLDLNLARVSTNRLITDAQIDELVAICDPPADKLRENIALEFERAALVLRSGRSVVGSRALRRAFQSQLAEAQRYAKKLGNILTKLNPELKIGLNSNFETAQNGNDNSAILSDLEYLIDIFADIDLLFPPGMKSEDILVWVIDGLIHAIETRLVPAFNCYKSPKRRRWFSDARQAKVIFAFLKTVEPEKCERYNLDYISYRIKCGKPARPARVNYNDPLHPELSLSTVS